VASARRDYYDVLGVEPGASDKEIKSAFRRLARELHPDVSDHPEAQERFRSAFEHAPIGMALISIDGRLFRVNRALTHMLGRADDSADWLHRAADRYRESFPDAPPGSWGRPIGAMKALLLVGDDAREAARWALDAGAADAGSPIGRYAGTLALLVLGRDEEAAALALTLEDDFPSDVAAALSALAAHDAGAYRDAVDSVRRSFEEREAFLEDVPVPDTALDHAASRVPDCQGVDAPPGAGDDAGARA